MRCFTLTENKTIGLHVTIHEGFPVVQIGKTGELHFVPLSDHFQELMKRMPPGAVDLMKRNPLEWASWDEAAEELGLDNKKDDTQALLHIATEPYGGLHLNSPVFKELIDRTGRDVIDTFEAFPPVGIEVLAIGGEENHMLVKMTRKAKFYIHRPGAPPGTWHSAKVVWQGDTVLVHPRIKMPQKTEAA